MNINKVLTRGYENKRLFRRAENKPNQTQFQTQFQTQRFFLPKGRSLLPEGSPHSMPRTRRYLTTDISTVLLTNRLNLYILKVFMGG